MSDKTSTESLSRGKFLLVKELMTYVAELPPRELFRHRRARWERSAAEAESSVYQAEFGLRVLNIDGRTGEMEIQIRLYLPESCATEVQIRGSFTGDHWIKMDSPGSGVWTFSARSVRPGMCYAFRYRNHDDKWSDTTDPLGYRFAKQFEPGEGIFNHYALVPDLSFRPVSPPSGLDSGLLICDCTLPGLLARWQNGRFFPREHGQYSLAERIVASGLISQLRRNGYNAVMFPLQSCVADLVRFDWKYSYLVKGIGGIDAQIGDWSDVKELVDAFHREGILVIPDLILVHSCRNASKRSIDHIKDPAEKPVWEDPSPNKHRDYGTWFFNLADPIVRTHVVDAVVRFVKELGLAAYRFDFMDGLLRQYKDRGETKNFGEILLEELHQALRRSNLHPVCLSEVFSERHNRCARMIADIVYQPWVGFVLVDEMLASPPKHLASGIGAIVDAVDRSATIDAPKATVAYAVSHDEAGKDGRDSSGKPWSMRPDWSIDGHLTQLVLNHALKLCDAGLLQRSRLLDFVADRVAVIEAVTLFSAGFAFMTVCDATDSLKLGSYDDPEGWQVAWDSGTQANLRRWASQTGLPVRTVRERIDRHAKGMKLMRSLFLGSTSVDFHAGRSHMDICCAGSVPQAGILAVLRENLTHPERSLLCLANLSLEPGVAPQVNVPSKLAGQWRCCAQIGPSEEDGCLDVSVHLAAGTNELAPLRLPANSLLVLQQIPLSPDADCA